jgi:hypothetical protein
VRRPRPLQAELTTSRAAGPGDAAHRCATKQDGSLAGGTNCIILTGYDIAPAAADIRSFTSAGGLTGLDMRAGLGEASSARVVDCADHRNREGDAPDEKPGVP